MFQRLSRMIRSFIGFFISVAEDPELILQQNIRDAYNGSHVIVPVVGKVQRSIVGIFQPALPGDPQIYFGPGPVNP